MCTQSIIKVSALQLQNNVPKFESILSLCQIKFKLNIQAETAINHIKNSQTAQKSYQNRCETI